MGRMIIGIDPGSEQTAYCITDGDHTILAADKLGNSLIPDVLRCLPECEVAVEGIQSYGMAVGREVFDTCYQIGRIMQICEDVGHTVTVYPRPEYANAIAGVGKVSDAVLRAALINRFGGDRKGEPLCALKGASDKRSAFAVAVYHTDLLKHGRAAKRK